MANTKSLKAQILADKELEKLETFAEKLAKIKADIVLGQADLDALDQKIADKEALAAQEVVGAKKQAEDIITLAKAERIKVEQEIEAKIQARNGIKLEADSREEMLNARENELDKEFNQLIDARKTLDSQAVELNAKQQALVKQEESLIKKSNEIVTETDQLEQLRGDITMKQQGLDQKKSEIDSILAQIQHERSENNRLKSDLQLVSVEAEEKTKKLVIAENAVLDLEAKRKDLERRENEVEEARQFNQELENRLRTIEESFKSLDAQYNARRKAIKLAEEAIAKKQKNNQEE